MKKYQSARKCERLSSTEILAVTSDPTHARMVEHTYDTCTYGRLCECTYIFSSWCGSEKKNSGCKRCHQCCISIGKRGVGGEGRGEE